MTGSAIGILIASLLGSVHCAGMCGGFVCFYAGSASPRHDAPMIRAHVLYNVGRLVSYLALGAAAGAIGSGVTRLGTMAGVARGATIVAGALMIAWAASAIAAQYGWSPGRATVPAAWQRLLGGLLHRVRDQSVGIRAALTGLATTLLPCGWLYVFVAAAAGTGNVPDAMLVMAMFWVGTVPALVAIGMGAQRVFGPLRRRLPTLGAVTVLVIGVLAVTGRLALSLKGAPHVH